MNVKRRNARTDLLAGTVAAVAATAVMTGVMKMLHSQLPPKDRHPLPPRPITMRVATEVAPDAVSHMDDEERRAMTLAAHFGYGIGTGALYGLLAPGRGWPLVAGGVGYGLFVWVGSYLGWLPALGILPPATRESAPRNAVMIAAHLAWGATLGAGVAAARGPVMDRRQWATAEAR